MPNRHTTNQIEFHYRAADSATSVTRDTAKRLAGHLGADETELIHRALRKLAMTDCVLPQYEMDDGPLTLAQLCQISAHCPPSGKQSVRSSLIDVEVT